MLWYLDPPWDRVVIGVTLAGLAVFLFWWHIGAYQRVYFPARAVGQAALKTAYWLCCFGLTIGVVYWAVSRYMAPGVARDLVGTAVMWAVAGSSTALVWQPLSRLIDRLLD